MSAADQPTPQAPAKRRKYPVGTELVIAILAVSMIQAFLVKPFTVPSSSMEQTLHIGDRIAANRLDTQMDRGDIVVFGHGETWADTRLAPDPRPLVRVIKAVGSLTGIGPSNTMYTVKRTMGLPGDTLACCSTTGQVLRNGTPLDEPYVFDDYPFTPDSLDCRSTPKSRRCFPTVTVPSGNLLVMGDHRSKSGDSVYSCRGLPEAGQCAKFVPNERVVGSVVFRFWPLNRFGRP